MTELDLNLLNDQPLCFGILGLIVDYPAHSIGWQVVILDRSSLPMVQKVAVTQHALAALGGQESPRIIEGLDILRSA